MTFWLRIEKRKKRKVENLKPAPFNILISSECFICRISKLLVNYCYDSALKPLVKQMLLEVLALQRRAELGPLTSLFKENKH